MNVSGGGGGGGGDDGGLAQHAATHLLLLVPSSSSSCTPGKGVGAARGMQGRGRVCQAYGTQKVAAFKGAPGHSE